MWQRKHSTALQAAVKQGYESIVRLLISHDANMNARGGKVECALILILANLSSHVGRMQFFLDRSVKSTFGD